MSETLCEELNRIYNPINGTDQVRFVYVWNSDDNGEKKAVIILAGFHIILAIFCFMINCYQFYAMFKNRIEILSKISRYLALFAVIFFTSLFIFSLCGVIVSSILWDMCLSLAFNTISRLVYLFAKISAFSLFIVRLYCTFEDTVYEINRCFLILLTSIYSISVTVLLIFNEKAAFSNPNKDYITNLATVTFLVDSLRNFILLFLFVYKLFQLTIDRRKSFLFENNHNFENENKFTKDNIPAIERQLSLDDQQKELLETITRITVLTTVSILRYVYQSKFCTIVIAFFFNAILRNTSMF